MAVPRPVSVIGVAVPTSSHQNLGRLRIRREPQSPISRLDRSLVLAPHLCNNHGDGYQRGN